MKNLLLIKIMLLLLALAFSFNQMAYASEASEKFFQAQQLLESGKVHLENFRSPIPPSYNLDYLITNYPDDKSDLLVALQLFLEIKDIPGLGQQAIDGLHETMKWLVKGQALLGNDHFVEALKMRFPTGTGTVTMAQEIDEFDNALQEYLEGTDYLNMLLEEPECFDEQGLRELTRVLFRQIQSRKEVADRLFAQDASGGNTGRMEAQQEIRRACQESYLGAAVLAANQDESDFSYIEVNRLHVNAVNAFNTFSKIAEGHNPGGFHGDYIPFLPFYDSNPLRSLWTIAQQSVTEAKDSETTARGATRQVDTDEYQLAVALSNISQGVKSELDELSGGLTNTYFPGGAGLNNPDNIEDFIEAAYNNTGTYSQVRQANEEAMIALERVFTQLQNVPKKIEIEQNRVGQIAEVVNSNAERFSALAVTEGYVNAFTTTTGVSLKGDFDVSVSFNPGSIVSGYINAEREMLRATQQVDIMNIDSAATIKLYMLEAAELGIALREHESRVNQTALVVDNCRKRMLSLVEQYHSILQDTASAYFSDPAYRLDMEETVIDARDDLRTAQEQCYLAARALGYDWADDFTGTSLSAPYNQFFSADSVFELNSASQVETFLNAVEAWATYNFNRGLQTTTETTIVSVRQDILGYSDWNEMAGDWYPLEVRQENKRMFKDFIRDHRTADNPDIIEFEFATSISGESIFPIYIASTSSNVANAKIAKIACDLTGVGYNPDGYGKVGLQLGGMSTVRKIGANWQPGNPPDASGDLLVNYDIEEIGNDPSLRTAFLTTSLEGFPVSPVWDDNLRRLSISSTSWKVTINTRGPQNQFLNFDDMTDIRFKIEWVHGQPPFDYSQP